MGHTDAVKSYSAIENAVVAGFIAHPVKHLLHKHEDLGTISTSQWKVGNSVLYLEYWHWRLGNQT